MTGKPVVVLVVGLVLFVPGDTVVVVAMGVVSDTVEVEVVTIELPDAVVVDGADVVVVSGDD